MAELVDAGNRVATAHKREGTLLGCFHDGVGDGTRSLVEVIEFEDAHRSVPEDGL